MPAKIRPAIAQRIEMLALSGQPPSRIVRTIEEEFADAPSQRTIERRAKRAIALSPASDTSGVWAFGSESDQRTARGLFDVLAALIDQGATRALTNTDASWARQILNVAPALPAIEVFVLARLYHSRRASKEPTDDLDAYLAFCPWLGTSHLFRYYLAIRKGFAASGPLYLLGVRQLENAPRVFGRAWAEQWAELNGDRVAAAAASGMSRDEVTGIVADAAAKAIGQRAREISAEWPPDFLEGPVAHEVGQWLSSFVPAN